MKDLFINNSLLLLQSLGLIIPLLIGVAYFTLASILTVFHIYFYYPHSLGYSLT